LKAQFTANALSGGCKKESYRVADWFEKPKGDEGS
jgi:hypothetical protein